MFTSKGIKKFCKVIVFWGCCFSVAVIVYGVSQLSNDNYIFPLILIGSAVLFSILATISVYPLYTMAHMSEKLESIEEKISVIANNSKKHQDEKRKTPVTRDDKEEIPAKQMNHSEKDKKEVVEFINNKYNINLHLDDSFDDLQSKIQAIEDDSPRAMLLIKKVSAASNKSEVLSALQMHKVTHS